MLHAMWLSELSHTLNNNICHGSSCGVEWIAECRQAAVLPSMRGAQRVKCKNASRQCDTISIRNPSSSIPPCCYGNNGCIPH